tara:strand:- start:387592 stop:388203 length:612 start_codon:yes stop_codon:yes gene_type:complete
MNPLEPEIQDDFERSLRSLRPSSTDMDPADVFYRAGLEAGAARKMTFGRSDVVRLLSVAAITGVVVGTLAYHAGAAKDLTDASDLAIVPPKSPSGQPVPSALSVAAVATSLDAIEKTDAIDEPETLGRARPSAAVAFQIVDVGGTTSVALSDRSGMSSISTSGLHPSFEIYRLPRHATTHVQPRGVLTARNIDAAYQRLGDLE